MGNLSRHRYAVVLMARGQYNPCVINPVSFEKWSPVIREISEQPDLSKYTWEARAIVGSGKVKSPPFPPENWEEIEHSFQELSWEHKVLPVTADPAKHQSELSGLKAGVTEIFHPYWKCSNIGAARNIQIGGLQLKGAGRTLPVNYLDHLMASGTMLLKESTHSFLISQLIETTFPLGGITGHGVLKHESGRSIFVRGAECPRIAMIGPDLDEKEKESLLTHLYNFHGSTSFEFIIRRIMGQYAALAALGTNIPGTPDNQLLDGRFVDEEDWCWPLTSTHGSFVVDADGKIDASDHLRIPWEKLSNIQSTFSYHAKMRKNLLTAFSFLKPHSVSEDIARQWFLEHLESLEGKAAVSFWEEGEASINHLSDWISKLSGAGFSFKVDHHRPPGRVSLKISPTGLKLQHQEGTGNRLAPFLEGNVDAFNLTRGLLAKAARLGIHLPMKPDPTGAPVPNTAVLKDYLKIEEERLGHWFTRVSSIIVKNAEGNEERWPIDLKGGHASGIPLAFVIRFHDRGELEIPARKIQLLAESGQVRSIG